MSNKSNDNKTPGLRSLAEQTGLIYISDEESGYTRIKRGKGFSYHTPSGLLIDDEKILNRINKLAIPPAWKDVWICQKATGHVQATGKDDKGRKQYIYHHKWEIVSSHNKFEKLYEFSTVLPTIREQVDKDLRKVKFNKNKVVAIIIYLLDKTLIRIGNKRYEEENESYGLTTFNLDHIQVDGKNLNIEFKGKSGKEREVLLNERRLARIVDKLQELPGQKLFVYYDDELDEFNTADSKDVNDYLYDLTGKEISAKDFRTWGGSVIAADELHNIGPAETKTEAKKNVIKAVKATAEILGNSPAVCRNYYIHPAIIHSYKKKKKDLHTFFEKQKYYKPAGKNALRKDEKALQNLLKHYKDFDYSIDVYK